MKAVSVVIAYDFICPWCWIGRANLATGSHDAELATGVTIATIRYVPFELNPWMPPEGMERREYRIRKFGTWIRSQNLDAQATAAGVALGLEFNHAAIARTPNTRLAHRLMQHATTQTEAPAQDALFNAISSAYFSQGRDIGSLDTLVEIAREQGFDADDSRKYLLSDKGNREVESAGHWASKRGISAVPTVLIDGQAISGAQPSGVFAEALNGAVQGRESGTRLTP